MSVTPETPQSRKEKWYAVIAGVTGIEPEEPQSREEKWLAYIAEILSGGGGGGGTSDHTQLSNRNVADQHPMAAITGLPEALAALEENAVATETTEVNLTNHKTFAVSGTPSALTVNLSAPTTGKEYLVGINFIAGADFALTQNAPEGYSIVWSDEPTWTAGKVYEVLYRCLWLTDGNGNVMISARFSEANVTQPEPEPESEVVE